MTAAVAANANGTVIFRMWTFLSGTSGHQYKRSKSPCASALGCWRTLENMLTHFPQAVPEIPVSNVEKAAEYYVNVLGFHFDWGDDAGGIGGISQGDCRMFLTNAPFRRNYATGGPVIVWLNL